MIATLRTRHQQVALNTSMDQLLVKSEATTTILEQDTIWPDKIKKYALGTIIY